MHTGCALLATLLGCTPLFAAPPACDRALAALQQQEDRAASAPRPAGALPAALLAARRDAARECLGAGAGVPVPAQPALRAPIAVPPATAPVVPPRPPAASALPALPGPAVPRTLGTCDATGCWTNDGQRLQRAGAQLIGPRGPCTAVGAVLHCP